MIRGFLLLSIGATLYANSDYIPFSKFSENEQIKHNFKKLEVNNNEKIEQVKQIKKVSIRNYKKASETNIIKKTEIRKPIKTNINKIEKNIIQEKEVIQNKEIIKEYKNDNILRKELKYTEKPFSDNFSITPKLTYTFLRHDGDYPDKVGLKDEESILIPEISLAYKNHILKAETMSTEGHFKRVIIDGSDLDTKTSWHKLNYLYKYHNAKIGLSYNNYKTKWNAIVSGIPVSLNEKRTFASLEVHLKNEKDNLQVEYGASLGKSGNVDIAYDYYVNLGYKIFKDDGLILSAGYRNRAIDFDSLKFEYNGPTISLSSRF
jgi:hypothetical protein